MNNFINPPLNYVDLPPQFSEFNRTRLPFNENRTINSNLLLHHNSKDTLTAVIPQNHQPNPHLVDNNLTDKKIDLQLIEYPLTIDSVNRNLTNYPDPFTYRVILKPSDFSPQPYILRDFVNIKYIKLDIAALPKNYRLIRTNLALSGTIYTFLDAKLSVASTYASIAALIDTSEIYTGSSYITYVNITYTGPSGALTQWNIESIINYDTSIIYVYNYDNGVKTFYTYSYDATYDLTLQRYITLQIEEIRDINENSTDNLINKSFSVLYPDRSTDNFVYFETNEVTKIFKSSGLGKLKNLSISFYDPLQRKLIATNLNTTIDTPSNCICTLNTDGSQNTIYRCASHYIRHPYYAELMNNIQIKIGVYEKNIDNRITLN